MITTIKNPVTQTESLPTLTSRRAASAVKTSDSSDVLSAAVLHKRRPQKRVRFALKLESVEEDSLSSSREPSPSIDVKSNKRIIDPWRQDGPLYGAYVEYLDKQDALTSNNFTIRRTPPPVPPHAPEPGAHPPTYTHTFVIQSKSPEIVIDSITVSTPPLHLPRILHHTQKTNKQKLPAIDNYFKQHLTLSTPPRMIHSNKTTNNSTIQKNHYASVHAALKRAELNHSTANNLQFNNKFTRSDSSFGSKLSTDPHHHNHQTKKMTEVITRPLPGSNNQINHFSERTILPNYSQQKSRLYNRTTRSSDEFKTNTPFFCETIDNDHLLQPIIHSNH